MTMDFASDSDKYVRVFCQENPDFPNIKVCFHGRGQEAAANSIARRLSSLINGGILNRLELPLEFAPVTREDDEEEGAG